MLLAIPIAGAIQVIVKDLWHAVEVERPEQYLKHLPVRDHSDRSRWDMSAELFAKLHHYRSSPEEHGLSRVLIDIVGAIDGSRRAGFLVLANSLIGLGFYDVLVCVEGARSIDVEGAAALIEMLERLRSLGAAAHLAVGRAGIAALQADASTAEHCSPLSWPVARWIDVDS